MAVLRMSDNRAAPEPFAEEGATKKASSGGEHRSKQAGESAVGTGDGDEATTAGLLNSEDSRIPSYRLARSEKLTAMASPTAPAWTAAKRMMKRLLVWPVRVPTCRRLKALKISSRH